MLPNYGALPEPLVPTRVTRGAVIAHRFFSLQNLAALHDFSPVSVSVERSWWLRSRWYGIGGYQESSQCVFIGLAARSPYFSYCFPFLFSLSTSWYCGAGVFGLIGCYSLSPNLTLPTFLDNNNNKVSSLHRNPREENFCNQYFELKFYWCDKECKQNRSLKFGCCPLTLIYWPLYTVIKILISVMRLQGCDCSPSNFIEASFSKLTDSNQILRNDFVWNSL